MFSYNPGNQNVSGQLVARGLQQGLAKVGEGLRDYRQKQADKEAEQAVIKFAMEKGWVKDEGEGKAAVKALGGGRAALPFLAQMQQVEQQQAIEQQKLQAEAAQKAQEEAAIAAALQRQMVPYGQGRGILRDPTTAPTPEQAVLSYMQAGGRNPQTATMLGKIPEATDRQTEILRGVFDPSIKPENRANAYVEQAAKLGIPVDPQIMQELRLANQAPDSPGQPYSQSTAFLDERGQYLGTGVFDQRTGEIALRKPGSDKLEPVPAGARPSTTAQVFPVESPTEFKKLAAAVQDSERTLGMLERYVKAQGGTDQGLKRIANDLTSAFKTLITGSNLTSEELAQRMAKGQLQGLIGRMRVNVVGGGTMTEKDAQRIVEYLGGDVGALQNPEVVQRALETLYRDKYREYEMDRTFYNQSVDARYGARGFEPAEAIPNLFEERVEGFKIIEVQ